MVHKPVILDHRYIIGHLLGGLGNHLWIYSSLYGIAKKTSRVPIACADYDIRRLFVNLTTLIHSTRECRESSQLNLDKLLSVIEHRNLYYDTSMIGWLKESKESHVLILNYFQNFGYFIEYTSDIKSQFVLGSKYTETAQSYLFSLLSKEMKCNKEIGSGHHEHISSDDKPVFVSVHVRRGDMLMQPYVQVPPASYFHNATQYFNRKYGCFVIFIVITDDLIWSKANIKGENSVFSADSGWNTTEIDFAIGVACNHSIISVGTFGWWIGFLAGGEVVYYKDWIKGKRKSWYFEGQYFPHYFTAFT